jgi:hypothetical protein
MGWTLRIPDYGKANERSLRNFQMQGNGAEMLRLACIYGTEAGIEVCAPVHDAVLICAPLERLSEDIAVMRALMGKASREVLGGFEIRTEFEAVTYPRRYMDEKRGAAMWQRVMKLIGGPPYEHGLAK